MIFNSLGSNYSFGFVLNTLFQNDITGAKKDLLTFLGEKYKGEVHLIYKGREAIRLALELSKLPKKSKVGITGFTCYAVYKAIVDAGMEVVYLDIDDTLNSSLEKLTSTKNLKALIIQNTLGYPCDITQIANFCKKNQIILIEDLAHSVGCEYDKGMESGSVGDFVIFSFSQDKIIDAVSGGALVVRNPSYKLGTLPPINKLKLGVEIRDRFYPVLTYLVRALYPLGIGKIFHYFLKKNNILSSPISELTTTPRELSEWYCSLVMKDFKNLRENLEARRKVAYLYSRILPKEVLMDGVVRKIGKSSNLRFPILVSNRTSLINYLKKHGVYVSDIWYDAPISPQKFLKGTSYTGECPVSEDISQKIVNLPTHFNISEKDANYISAKINEWQKLQ